MIDTDSENNLRIATSQIPVNIEKLIENIQQVCHCTSKVMSIYVNDKWIIVIF